LILEVICAIIANFKGSFLPKVLVFVNIGSYVVCAFCLNELIVCNV
jgi:hypothetical protein